MATIFPRTEPGPLITDRQHQAMLISDDLEWKATQIINHDGQAYRRESYLRYPPSSQSSFTCGPLSDFGTRAARELGKHIVYCDPDEKTPYGCADKVFTCALGTLCFPLTCGLFCSMLHERHILRGTPQHYYVYLPDTTHTQEMWDADKLGFAYNPQSFANYFDSHDSQKFVDGDPAEYVPILRTPHTNASKIFFDPDGTREEITLHTVCKPSGDAFTYMSGLQDRVRQLYLDAKSRGAIGSSTHSRMTDSQHSADSGHVDTGLLQPLIAGY